MGTESSSEQSLIGRTMLELHEADDGGVELEIPQDVVDALELSPEDVVEIVYSIVEGDGQLEITLAPDEADVDLEVVDQLRDALIVE